MGEVVVGTNTGAELLPARTGPNGGLRCPDHPMWYIAVRLTQRTLPDGRWKHVLRTGECPQCGWKPTDIDRTGSETP